jgi:hypothetical protein
MDFVLRTRVQENAPVLLALKDFRFFGHFGLIPLIRGKEIGRNATLKKGTPRRKWSAG